MSTDIERLLAAATDDSDQPLHTDVEDKSIVSTCRMDSREKPWTNGRVSTTVVMPMSRNELPQAVENGLRVPADATPTSTERTS